MSLYTTSDEASTMVVLSRLSYENDAIRRAIVAGSYKDNEAPDRPQVEILTGNVQPPQPGSRLPRSLHAFGFQAATIAEDLGRDTFDTQAFLASYGRDALVVVFRGTEPMSLTDWSADFSWDLQPTPGLGCMHSYVLWGRLLSSQCSHVSTISLTHMPLQSTTLHWQGF